MTNIETAIVNDILREVRHAVMSLLPIIHANDAFRSRIRSILSEAHADMGDDTAKPVAWRVKDFADGWVLFHDEASALREAAATGAVHQPLYAGASRYAAAEKALAKREMKTCPNCMAPGIKRVDGAYSCDMCGDMFADEVEHDR